MTYLGHKTTNNLVYVLYTVKLQWLNMKKKNTLNYPKSAMGFFSKRLKNEFDREN